MKFLGIIVLTVFIGMPSAVAKTIGDESRKPLVSFDLKGAINLIAGQLNVPRVCGPYLRSTLLVAAIAERQKHTNAKIAEVEKWKDANPGENPEHSMKGLDKQFELGVLQDLKGIYAKDLAQASIEMIESRKLSGKWGCNATARSRIKKSSKYFHNIGYTFQREDLYTDAKIRFMDEQLAETVEQVEREFKLPSTCREYLGAQLMRKANDYEQYRVNRDKMLLEGDRQELTYHQQTSELQRLALRQYNVLVHSLEMDRQLAMVNKKDSTKQCSGSQKTKIEEMNLPDSLVLGSFSEDSSYVADGRPGFSSTPAKSAARSAR